MLEQADAGYPKHREKGTSKVVFPPLPPFSSICLFAKSAIVLHLFTNNRKGQGGQKKGLATEKERL
jgi:hypothetical protein